MMSVWLSVGPVGDPDKDLFAGSGSSPLDPDPALGMYIYQLIFSKKMFLTNFFLNCHDLDTKWKFLLYIT
jgi:hypothetical protein